jgi:hypothetical protein
MARKKLTSSVDDSEKAQTLTFRRTETGHFVQESEEEMNIEV